MATANYQAYLMRFNWVPIEPYDPRRDYQAEIGQQIVSVNAPTYRTTLTSSFYGSGNEAGPGSNAFIPTATLQTDYSQPSLIRDINVPIHSTISGMLPPRSVSDTFGPSDMPQRMSIGTRGDLMESVSPVGSSISVTLPGGSRVQNRIISSQETISDEYTAKLEAERDWASMPSLGSQRFSEMLVGKPSMQRDTAGQAIAAAVEFGITLPEETLNTPYTFFQTAEYVRDVGIQQAAQDFLQTVRSEPVVTGTKLTLGAAVMLYPAGKFIKSKIRRGPTYQIRGYESDFIFNKKGPLTEAVGQTRLFTDKGPDYFITTKAMTFEENQRYASFIRSVGMGKDKGFDINTGALTKQVGNDFLSNELSFQGQYAKGRQAEFSVIRRNVIDRELTKNVDAYFGAGKKITKKGMRPFTESGAAFTVGKIEQGSFEWNKVLGTESIKSLNNRKFPLNKRVSLSDQFPKSEQRLTMRSSTGVRLTQRAMTRQTEEIKAAIELDLNRPSQGKRVYPRPSYLNLNALSSQRTQFSDPFVASEARVFNPFMPSKSLGKQLQIQNRVAGQEFSVLERELSGIGMDFKQIRTTAQRQRFKQNTRLEQRMEEAIGLRSMQRQRIRERTDMRQRNRTEEILQREFGPPIRPTFFGGSTRGILPLPLGFGDATRPSRSKKKRKSVRIKRTYQPSLTGIATGNILPRIPAGALTGIVPRIPVRRKRK